MPKESRVFVIEHPRNRIDVSKAEEYGNIVYIFDNKERRCTAWLHVEYGQTILRRLKTYHFDPKIDFVCIVGAMLTITVYIIVVAQYYSEFKALLFDSRDNRYVQKKFDRNDWAG